MRTQLHKIRPLLWCSILSVLVHLLLLCSLRMFGSYDFGAPVNSPLAVMVDLATLATAVGAQEPAAIKAVSQKTQAPAGAPAKEPAKPIAATVERKGPEPDLGPEAKPASVPQAQPDTEMRNAAPDEEVEERKRSPRRYRGPRARPVVTADAASVLPRPLPAAKELPGATADMAPTMLQSVSQFLSARYEKLTYLISMYGIPIGNAELESKTDDGVTVISLKVKSNPVLSSYFPVDNLVETRHIDGMFVVTSIKQNEGAFQSDQSFTINVPKKRVSCFDFKNSRSLTMDVPSGDVLDTLSGIYYLRNRQLEVGRTEILHIFDSETYGDVPVEILRKEEMRLPNLAKVDTVVVRPLQTTPGIFRRTGELLIWMTDDDRKVPVKISTSVAIGRVTAELVSAESQPHQEAGKSAQLSP